MAIIPLRLMFWSTYPQNHIIKCDENIDQPDSTPILINTDEPGHPTAITETVTYKIEAGEQHKTPAGTIHIFRISKNPICTK